MTRRLALVVAVIFAVGSIVCGFSKDAFAGEYKIGCVDPIKILNDYNKTKSSEKSFEVKRAAKEADRKKMIDEIKKLTDEQALLSEKAKAEKQAIINEKKKVLFDFDKKAREDLTAEGNTMLEGIQKDIEKVISEYAKEQSYDIVMNSRVLLYKNDALDFTEEIIKRLNK